MPTSFLDALEYLFLSDLSWCLRVDVTMIWSIFGVFWSGQVIVGALRQVEELLTVIA